ncbi:MAG: ABC transporter substrate-binding protein [Actinobacteria bacterium]|jgi:ABC-type transport system substrate-binding protein|nr:ABC transporter substrate-binding protein [Actinomycetota bacterium]
MSQDSRLRQVVSAVAAVVALGLFAAACGSSSGGDNSATASSDVTVKVAGDPTPGGTVKFAVEAESDGFNPTTNRWAVSGHMVGSAVFDPLAAYDENGKAQPYLAKSFTPSADFKTWTIELRPNVNFSDGTPVDSAAVTKSLNTVRKDPLVGIALANVATVTASGPLSVTLVMIDPDASLPAGLTTQVGYVVAPAQLDAPSPANTRAPIGSGPFTQKEWVPDNRWVGEKNANYWRSDAKGNKLPYLDSLEFRPITDPQSRVNALLAGDVNMLHTTDFPAMAKLKSEAQSGALQVVFDQNETEESFVMFNTAKAPLNDVRVREGLKLCTDPAEVRLISEVPEDRAADSQFKKDSPWYSDSGFTTNDPAAGKALLEQVKAEKGPISFTLGTTPVPANVNVTALLKQQWEACGVSVTTTTTEQSKFILDMATGNYQADLTRQFSGTDPAVDYVWWTGKNATGPLALNFARLNDPELNAALDKGRASPDISVRKEAYATVQQRQTALVPYIWIAHTQWAIAGARDIRNFTSMTLPDGAKAQSFQGGTVKLTETWIAK